MPTPRGTARASATESESYPDDSIVTAAPESASYPSSGVVGQAQRGESRPRHLAGEGSVRAIARGDQDAPAKSDFLSAIGQHAEGLGGGVSGGLESLLGAVGLTGLQKRLAGWSEDPANKKLLGGTTAIAGTLLTAMLARKLLGGRSQRQEPNYGPMTREASLSPASIFAAGMVKRGYPQTMGTPIKPLKGQKSKTATPRRLGIHGSHRQRTHDKLKQQRVASASPLGR